MICMLIIEDLPEGGVHIKTIKTGTPAQLAATSPAEVLCEATQMYLDEITSKAKKLAAQIRATQWLKGQSPCLH